MEHQLNVSFFFFLLFAKIFKRIDSLDVTTLKMFGAMILDFVQSKNSTLVSSAHKLRTVI